MSRRKSSIAPSLFGVARCGECHSARCRTCEKLRERNCERMRMGQPYGRISREFGPMTRLQMCLATTARNPLEAAQQAGRETRALFRWGNPLGAVHFPPQLFYPTDGGLCLCTVHTAQFYGQCGHVGLCRNCLMYHLTLSEHPQKCPYCKAVTNYYMEH
ncbi:hypothetical protein niasHT_024917 [Heterodera trifolii]|uniref:RING-type domain-containing protein n=1 Tax=Heterodera trifolii TaxID=157864 RepID=A0ABD2KP38_9BILA